MRSLAFKFTIVLVLVSLVGIALVTIVASRVTQQEFARFLDQQDMESLLDTLAELYQTNGGWDNINQRDLRSALMEVLGNSQNTRMIAIADRDGNVILASPTYSIGTQISGRELSSGMSIEVNGEAVGSLISKESRAHPLTALVQRFTETINRSLLYIALIAVGLSILLGVIFSRTLTRQLIKLAHAAQDIANGELEQRVEVRSKDEIGQLAEAFNQMSANLERSRVLRRQMTADIAHELRTPLSIILGRAETLADGMLPPSQETFNVIHDETLRVNRLVEDLRMLSLSDAGELSLEKRPVDICRLLDEAQRAHTSATEMGQIDLQIDCPAQLPVVIADPDRLGQVLDNLIRNAIRYTPEGGCIRLSAQVTGQVVEIVISDTGKGIVAEDIPHLFDRFYRGDKARQREKGGSGLGLAIAKSLVNAHGGEIHVKSKPGAGTTFIIRLPIS